MYRRLPLLSLFTLGFSLSLAGGAVARPAPTPQVERGLSLLLRKGCSGCHTFDGRPAVGPTFVGLWGKDVRVVSGNTPKVVRVDRAYVERAVRAPNCEVVEGFRPGSMPEIPVDQQELDAMVAAVQHIGSEKLALPWHYYAWLWALAVTALLFVGSHLLLSTHPIRRSLVDWLGSTGFLTTYSAVAAGSFFGMVIAWTQAPLIPLWAAGSAVRYVPLLGMPFVLLLLVGSGAMRNPTAAGQEGLLAADFVPRGMLKITRHPLLWAFALFGLLHIPPNGDVAALVLFGSIVALALVGMVHIDRRRARAHGVGWARYAAQTSLVPFAAIIGRKQRLRWHDIGVPNIVIAFVLYCVLLALHVFWLNVWPFPDGLQPLLHYLMFGPL